MHGQYLEQQALTRPAGFYARGLSRRRVPRGPAIVVALSKRGRWGGGGIYSLRYPSRPLGANLATKRRASIWDLGHAPCLQHGMKERVV